MKICKHEEYTKIMHPPPPHTYTLWMFYNIVGHESLNKVPVSRVISMAEELLIVPRRSHAWMVRPRQWHVTRGGHTVLLRKAAVIKSRRNIFENYFPQTLLRKNFFAPHLTIHCFSLLFYQLYPIKVVVVSLKPNFLAYSLQIYCIGLFEP